MSSGPLFGGRYELHAEIGSGGMASVHLARLRGAGGFARVVAIKRMHPHLAKDPDFVAMFLDEARVASRVHHPNVVAITDVVSAPKELFLVMEYVPGVALSELLSGPRLGNPPPIGVALRIVHDALSGLHAAHTAKDEHGAELHLVHRDVSPQNFLVGDDGVTRVLDFGIAKADGRLQPRTAQDQIKGKLGYMAPEQLMGEAVDPRTDVYAVGVCLWETLLAKRARQGNDAEILRRIIDEDLPSPKTIRSEISPALEALLCKATHRDRRQRFRSAGDMAQAVAGLSEFASHAEVKAWLRERASPSLDERAALVASIEAETTRSSETDATTSVPPQNTTEPIRGDKTSSGMSAPIVLPRAKRRGLLVGASVGALMITAAAWWFFRGGTASTTPTSESLPAERFAVGEAPTMTPSATDTPEPVAPPDTSTSAASLASDRVSPPRPVETPRNISNTPPLTTANRPAVTTANPRKETLY